MKAFSNLTKKQKTIGLIALGLILILAFFYNSEFLRPDDRKVDSEKVVELKEKENEDLNRITGKDFEETKEETIPENKIETFYISSDKESALPNESINFIGEFTGEGDFSREIKWSIVNPHSESTVIDENGVLKIAADETSDRLLIRAEADNGNIIQEKSIAVEKPKVVEEKQPEEKPKKATNKEELKAIATEEQANITEEEKIQRDADDKKIKQEAIIATSSGPKDKYLTDPTPEGKPKPVEPGTEAISEELATAYLSIDCKTILDNMDRFDLDKIDVLPVDGIILARTEVQFHPGESVYDILMRETRNRGIHMQSSFTPMYNSAYVEGIHNLYEFDTGELSGWMYKVNGWFPNYGCSRYLVQPGDEIVWRYTCDLGRDVGDNSMMK